MINSVKSPASAAGTISEPRLMSEQWPKSCARISVFFCGQSGGGVPVFVCLRSSCNHVTEVGGS